MRAEFYRIATAGGGRTVCGHPVWGTRRLFAVDERRPDNWVVTHLPTGRRVGSARTRKEAEDIARAVLRACVVRGLNAESDQADWLSRWYCAASPGQRREFRFDARLAEPAMAA